jgi:hypothetical protein
MKFYCAFCGSGIEWADAPPKARVTCPDCQAEFAVPEIKNPAARIASGIPASQSKESAVDLPNPAATWGRQFRRVFLYGLLGCFVVGATTAIVALLSLELGEFQAKILLTTLSLGAYSLTGVCCAILADQRRYSIFAGLGIAASIVGALFAILTNWQFVTGLEILLKGRFSLLVIAISFGHAALLLLLQTTDPVVRTLRMVTLGIIALVALLLLGITLNPISLNYAWSILGVFGVLDVLGTLATPILHMATRGSKND